MTFEEAQNSVKIGHFTRKGGKIRGVIHVGANDGEEIEGYIGLGAERVIAFEPLITAQDKLWDKFGEDPRISIWACALGLRNGHGHIKIAHGDGKGSTFLEELNSPYQWIGEQCATIRTLDSIEACLKPCNTLVVDVQGMEYDVLYGALYSLRAFDFLNIECSRTPLYQGERPADEIIEFLSSQGFQQDSPVEDHNDIFFVRRTLGWPTLY